LQRLHYHGTQTIKALAHVDRRYRHKNPPALCQPEHGSSASSLNNLGMLLRLGILKDTDSPLRNVRCIDIGSTLDTQRSLDSATGFTTTGTNRIDRLVDGSASATDAASLRDETA
jgi:hypothetical protein